MEIMLNILAWVNVLLGLILIYVIVRKKRKVEKGELIWAVILVITFLFFALNDTFGEVIVRYFRS